MTVVRSGVAFIAFGGGGGGDGGCLCIQHTCSLRKYPTFFPSPPLRRRRFVRLGRLPRALLGVALQPVGLPSQDLWQGVVGANHHTIFTPQNILSVAASHY